MWTLYPKIKRSPMATTSCATQLLAVVMRSVDSSFGFNRTKHVAARVIQLIEPLAQFGGVSIQPVSNDLVRATFKLLRFRAFSNTALRIGTHDASMGIAGFG